MRVAFTLIGGAQWTGGRTYLANLLQALRDYESGEIDPVLFVGEDTLEGDLLGFSDIAQIVRSPVFDKRGSGARLLSRLIRGSDGAVTELFGRLGIVAVFENSTFFGRSNPFPTIAWMPDFQHRRMPHLFGAIAYWHRELGFRAQVASKRLIMLSSDNARKDCELFYRKSVGRTAVVHFAAIIDSSLMENQTEATLTQYALTRPFYYLPNQFWQHKNHRVVIEALGILKQRGTELIVAASGSPTDTRQPQHFASLQQRIQELGLKDNFRMLGMIPRRHVITLMRTCTTLINPSRFEGWSSTVEEARALGVPMILSNIGTHREQMRDKATYFDPDNPSALAAALVDFSERALALVAPRGIEPSSRSMVKRFAAEFVQVVKRASGDGVELTRGVERSPD